MPDLQFQIEGAEAVPHAAVPLIALKLRVTSRDEPIHTLTLRCQVQIEPAKRRYVPGEQEKLLDLFGTPERWSRTVRPLLWMNTTVAIPGFTDTVVVDLQLPCTFDFNVAATKYFHALDAGDIPAVRDVQRDNFSIKVRRVRSRWRKCLGIARPISACRSRSGRR